ncbi:glycoside hydrolase family 17 protein [Jackrogersella minutella]|nr:glycoside hydrolase family 17 protein [Jackrogersella minutella]
MRFTVSLTLLSVLHLSAGQLRHNHAHRHKSNRDVIPTGQITITDTTRSIATQIPEVVIYVDQHNKPLRTTTEMVAYVPASVETHKAPAPQTSTSVVIPPPAEPVSAEAIAPPMSSSSALETSNHVSTFEPVPSPLLSPTSLTSLTTYSTTSSTPSSVPSSTPSPPVSGGGALHGVTYSPYKGKGGCKSAAEVEADFALIAKDYGVIRLYGVDCNQVATVYAAAKKYGNKLFLGIFDIHSVDQSVAAMAAGLNNDWSIVDTVSVGNELVNNGAATVNESLLALNQTRSALKVAGYHGPVVIVDTFVAMSEHPELCDHSDYCAVNIHAFFTATVAAPGAGDWVTKTMNKIKAKLSDPNKRMVVTESGWPWKGIANSAAVPSMDQQSIALSTIKSAYADHPSDLILFTSFNDMWKKPEPATYMAEQFWGMGGLYSPCDE